MRRVALIYDARLAYDLKVMAGVAAFIRECANFNVYIEENALKDQKLPDLRTWGGDGIIADFDHPLVAAAVTRSKRPVVGFGSGYGWYVRESSVPYFFTNNTMIAQMAAQHLVVRGIRNFAFVGYGRTRINAWSEEREIAFVRALKAKGHSCVRYLHRYATIREWATAQQALAKWLRSLPKPLGVMAANDRQARNVLVACRDYGLRVPEDVAVIGVDNDELLCQLSSPPLTSVEQGARRMGYEAAALLERLMSGMKVRQRHFVIDPTGIVTRQSTDTLAVEDTAVARAMLFIQEQASNGIKVPDVVSATAVSRSGLETRFIKSLGYTIHAAIRNVQLERSRRFISETDLPLKQVAALSGFRSVQHMTTLFGKAFHLSPARFRNTVALS